MSNKSHNMQDVADHINCKIAEHPNDSGLKKARAALNKTSRIFGKPLCNIPADINFIAGELGTGPVRMLPKGFPSIANYKTYRKDLKSGMRTYLRHLDPAICTPASMLSDGKAIVDYVRANGGVTTLPCGATGKKLPPHLEHSIGALARAAGAAGLRIAELNDDNTQELINGLKGSSKRSAKLGVKRINELIARRDEFPEIDILLPRQLLVISTPVAKPSDKYARTSKDPCAQLLWEDVATFAIKRRSKDESGNPIPPEESEFGKLAEKKSGDTVKQAINVLIADGHLTGTETLRLRDACNDKMIKAFAVGWQRRMKRGEVSKDSDNLYGMVSRLKVMAETMGAGKKERKRIQKLIDKIRGKNKPKRKTGKWQQMASARKQFVRNFSRDYEYQIKLFSSPELLRSRAQKILDNWDRAKNHERMLAIKMGVAACCNAILYRASPIRRKNLNQLRFRGESATLIMNDNDDLYIFIPGSEVKNRCAIEHDADDDALPIVKWYIANIRHKWIRDHPYGCKMIDSDYLFPSLKADAPLDPDTLADHYACGIGQLGLAGLTFHLARHISVFLILAEQPNAWDEACEILGDKLSTVQDFYAWMDTERIQKQGRVYLQAAVKRAKKYKKGRRNV